MYYCLKDRSLIDRLRELRDEDDYVRFLDAGFDDDDNQISIYIDDYHKPKLDWIKEEKAEKENSGTDEYEDDVDSVLSDDLLVDHEADDEDIEWPELVDPFLSQNNLIPEIGIGDEAIDKGIYGGELLTTIHKQPNVPSGMGCCASREQGNLDVVHRSST
uniref:Uncharacterized protein n=1 Tax=Lactuca sativa TaxID=4236 RepID=A0A9R1USI6_LACSA|nr:hypothetical protein LSAT_V11C800417760 [Lactuca sativa]